jgi:hypothetical protein
MKSISAFLGLLGVCTLITYKPALAQDSLAGALDSPNVVSTPSATSNTAPGLVSVKGIDLDVNAALANVANQGKVIIMAAPGTSGKLDLNITDVSTESALNSITRATYLQWRKIWAAPGTSRDELQKAVSSADSVAKTNIVVASSSGSSSTASIAILSGPAAKNIADHPTTLGLREIIWVYTPAVASKTAAAPTAAPATGTAAKEAATAEPTAEKTYQAITDTLSKLNPTDALNILEQARMQVMQDAGMLDQQLAYNEPAPTGTFRGMSRQPKMVTPRPGRVKQYTPAGQGVIFQPYYYGY